MIKKPDVIKYKYEIAFVGILVLSAILNLWNIWAQGISNEYYAAAVKSMIDNPGLIFFNSFDPAGFVTVDKPPVGLWVQIASAALFGFSGWSLVLPQALAGVASVGLIYYIVYARFGKPAGLIAALALAVTPIFVAVSRNGTMDMQLIFVLLLATIFALKAAREQSLPYLLLSVVFIGIGFNIKMIQAFIIVPAVIIVYILGTRKIPVKMRAIHIALALVVLLSVSLSWAVVVDTVPANERPYIGGSGDNTVLGLIINYNGIHRLENGMTMQGNGPGFSPPTGGMPVGPGQASFVPGNGIPGGRNNESYPRDPPGYYDALASPGQQPVPPNDMGSAQVASHSDGGMGGGMMQDTGSPGIFRLLSEGLAGQISWLIPFALIGLLVWWRWPLNGLISGSPDLGLGSEKGLTLTFLALWLLPGLTYFSFTTGFWHPYYIATIAPPLAALAGIGAVMMYRVYCSDTWKGWLLVTAVLVTGLVQVMILSYYSTWSGILVPALLFGTIVVTLVLVLVRLRTLNTKGNIPKITAVIAIAFLFVAPFIWACTPMVYNNGGILPAAGPQLSRNGMPSSVGNNTPGSGSLYPSLATYLTSHNTGETWYVAVQGSNEATSLIIDSEIPVMSMGGFSGTDQVLTIDKLRTLIDDGRIRYFLLPSSSQDNGMAQGNSEIYSYVRNQSTVIPVSEWGGSAEDLQNSNRTNVNTGNSPGPRGNSPGQWGQYSLYDVGNHN